VSGQPKRGVALITALALMVMMTAIALKLFSRLSQQTFLATYEQRYQQASWYLASAESLALATLRRSLVNTSRGYMDQARATMTHRFPVAQGTITVTLSDQQTCFNINALANSNAGQQTLARKQLSALLSLLAVPATRAEKLVDYFEQFAPQDNGSPILLLDISELRAIASIDAGLYKTIAPFICALPDTRQRININTLTEEQAFVLAALFSPWLTPGQARTLLQQRPKAGWESVEQFLNESPLAKVDGAIKMQLNSALCIESHYFLLLAEIEFEAVRRVSRSLISRSAETQFSVLWHQTGEIE